MICYRKGIAVFLCVFLMITAGCTHRVQEGGNMIRYERALAETDPAKVGSPQPGSELEKEAIARFVDFYRVFSSEAIRKGLRGLYADGAYFRDGFKEVVGIDAMEAYFLNSAEGIQTCTFDIQARAVHEGNYYFRWVMHLTMKRSPDDPIQTAGMSHVRYDAKGRVTFHQDYWDTAVVYEKVPLLGTVIRWIKKRF
ncbi:MAG: nuclear transport factor 2 family protein [Thermodesulfobacteriota bacterium]